jgi:hypothetical protein|tara:strand:+ start:231 stop:533 length:303 start_codon:yes stop_codon:yes gene_type:complete
MTLTREKIIRKFKDRKETVQHIREYEVLSYGKSYKIILEGIQKPLSIDCIWKAQSVRKADGSYLNFVYAWSEHEFLQQSLETIVSIHKLIGEKLERLNKG